MMMESASCRKQVVSVMDKLTLLLLDLTPLPKDLCSIISTYLRSSQPWSVKMKNELLEDIIISDTVTTDDNPILVMFGLIDCLYSPHAELGFICPAVYTINILEPNLSTNINFLQMIKTGYIHDADHQIGTSTKNNKTKIIFQLANDNDNGSKKHFEFHGDDDRLKVGERKFVEKSSGYETTFHISGINSFKFTETGLFYYRCYNQGPRQSYQCGQLRQAQSFLPGLTMSTKYLPRNSLKILQKKIWMKEEEICQHEKLKYATRKYKKKKKTNKNKL
jgi:hypothetical protein